MWLSKFLDPKNDFAFKRIFGSPRNKEILIHFINDMLQFTGEKAVVKVSLLKTIQDPEIASKKQSILDVLCTDQRGTQYIIEMQVAKTKGFEKRAQYYAAKAYSQQLMEGEQYEQLKEIIFIAITDFVMFEHKSTYYSNYCLLDRVHYTHDLKDFLFTFLELPKFHKGIEELTSVIDKWAYFFKYAEATREEELEKIVGDDQVIGRAYQELNRYGWSTEELNTYEQEEKRERDALAILAQKEAEGRAAGIAEGRAAGIAEGKAAGIAEGKAAGIAEGRAAGIAEGRAEGERAMHYSLVKKLLAKGHDDREIMELVSLTAEELIEIKQGLETLSK